MLGADLEPHDLAEAPAAELVLDRLEQVVGLVVDLEVGVARDPEQVVADDLQPGEQRVEVLGDDLLERDERVLGDLDEPRQHLLRHLHARVRVVVEIGIAQPDDQAQRQVRDVRERAPGADRERRQHREDLLAEVALDHVVRRRSDSSQLTIRMPCSASSGWITSVNWREWRRSSSAHLLGDPLERLASATGRRGRGRRSARRPGRGRRRRGS